MAAAVVPVRIRRSIVHIERERATIRSGVVRTAADDEDQERRRRGAPYDPKKKLKDFVRGRSPRHLPSRYAAGISQERPQPTCQPAIDGAAFTWNENAPPFAAESGAPPPTKR